ncbi:MAG: hypothetical protein AAGG75_20540 [Bacteroidota bacterium]
MSIKSGSIALLLALLFPFSLKAQGHPFPPGLYCSAESLQEKKPDFTFDEVEIDEGKNYEFNLLLHNSNLIGQSTNVREDYLNSVYIERVMLRDSVAGPQKLDISKIKAVATKESLFFRINAALIKRKAFDLRRFTGKKANMFVRAQKIGQLCHITQESIQSSSAMDNRPARAKSRSRDRYSANQFIYSIPQGRLRPYGPTAMELAIADDEKLLAHFKKNEDKKNQLFLYLLKYNERNKL